jgi:predicted GNAT family acetyltransferase
MTATVRHNPRLSRYEVAVRTGALAGVALYQRHERRIAFLETAIETRHEGPDLGGRLARAALDDARELDLEVVSLCPFIAAYIRRHADEYLDLVVPAMRRRWSRTAGRSARDPPSRRWRPRPDHQHPAMCAHHDDAYVCALRRLSSPTDKGAEHA